ncbi:MAG TPA: glycyl-radical enzyme activating protein [Thermoguttaceae bacterium]|nr:glycyl-radical enzyme activating protein [Thermoguttaceae bacterium]
MTDRPETRDSLPLASPTDGKRSLDRSGIIFDIKRYAIHDGPGIRTTVFLKGCPLKCRWCHNPESWRSKPEHSLRVGRCTNCGQCVEACPRGAISSSARHPVVDLAKCDLCGACVDACPTGAREILGRCVTVREILREIERDVVFFDQSDGGVTLSGGEPLAQPGFVTDILKECKAREIHTALDTSCYAAWETVAAVTQDVDLLLVDLKHLDPAEHQRLTGVSNDLILNNLRRLDGLNKEIIIRIPIIPGVTDSDTNIMATGNFLAGLARVVRVDILPQNEAATAKAGRLAEDYDLLPVNVPDPERVDQIASRLREMGFTVKIGG